MLQISQIYGKKTFKKKLRLNVDGATFARVHIAPVAIPAMSSTHRQAMRCTHGREEEWKRVD